MLLNWSLRGTSRCRRKQGNEQRCMTTGSLGKGGAWVETNVFFLQIFYLKYSRLHSTVYYQRGSVDLLKLTDALHMTHFFRNGKKMRRWLSSKCISNGNQGKNMTAGVMFCLLVCDSFFSSTAFLAKAIYTAHPLTYRRGNSHSSWSGQWANAPDCYQLTGTLSMCVTHSHHETNALCLLKKNPIVTIGSLQSTLQFNSNKIYSTVELTVWETSCVCANAWGISDKQTRLWILPCSLIVWTRIKTLFFTTRGLTVPSYLIW